MTTETKQQTRIYVQTAAAVCENKKGLDTRILELDPIDSGLSDFFLITSASNDRQAIAIADEIEGRLKMDFGVFPNSVEGRRQGQWILLDYVDFVVHVFLADRRAFYDIERLRKSARPLTPAEFDAELKAELAAKTLAARGKAAAKPKLAIAKVKKQAAKPALRPKNVSAAPKPTKPAKKSVSKPAPAPKKASKKAAKKSVVKSKTSKPPAKKAAANKKPAAKKAAHKKSPAKNSAARKTVTRKPAPKKKKR
jgi:ribosome-associated protein